MTTLAKKIDSWYEKNTKLYEISHLEKIKKYLTNQKIVKKEISISNDFKFEYYDDEESLDNIRYENIFKLNFLLICSKLREYFPKVEIGCLFEESCMLDKEIQKGNAVFKHDVYIAIYNDDTGKIYDCAIEYFEEKSHKKRSVDNDKQIYIEQLAYYYIVYKEQSDSLDEFYRDTIYKLMLLICTAENDHYTLTKINFFKNNQSNPKKLKNQTETFNQIITYHKENRFNFLEFFNEILPINPETEEEFNIDDFIEFLEENYELSISPDKNGFCDYDTFSLIIMNLDSTIARTIKYYKLIYVEAMKIIVNSHKELLVFSDSVNDKRLNMPDFVDTFLKNHIQCYKKKFTLVNVLENLTETLKR
jgi:hypothetical protein